MTNCTECYNICSEGIYNSACVCLNGDFPSVFGSLIIEANDPRVFYTLYKNLKKVQPIVSKIVKLTISYDLPQMISTHQAMTRRIARLRKLLKILDSISIEVKTLHNNICYITYRELARPIVEIIEEIIDVMEYFKNDYHRTRDAIHQYLYPIMKSALESLKHIPTIVYSPYFTSIPTVQYKVLSDKIELELKTNTVYRVIYVTDSEFEKLLEKPPEQVRETLNEIIEKRLNRLRRKKLKPKTRIPWKILEVI